MGKAGARRQVAGLLLCSIRSRGAPLALVVPLLEAMLLGWLDRTIAYLRSTGSAEVPRWRYDDQRIGKDVLDAVRHHAIDAGACSPHPSAVEDDAARLYRRRWPNEDWSQADFRLQHAIGDACDLSRPWSRRPSPVWRRTVLTSSSSCSGRSLEGEFAASRRAIAKGLKGGSDRLADGAITWLCERSGTFFGWGSDHRASVGSCAGCHRAVSRQPAAHRCSSTSEGIVLTFHPLPNGRT